MAVPIALRQQDIQPLAHGFGGTPTEDRFGAAVETDDALEFIDEDDGVNRSLENRLNAQNIAQLKDQLAVRNALDANLDGVGIGANMKIAMGPLPGFLGDLMQTLDRQPLCTAWPIIATFGKKAEDLLDRPAPGKHLGRCAEQLRAQAVPKTQAVVRVADDDPDIEAFGNVLKHFAHKSTRFGAPRPAKQRSNRHSIDSSDK